MEQEILCKGLNQIYTKLWSKDESLITLMKLRLGVIHKWRPHWNLQILTRRTPSPLSRYGLNASPPSNRTSRIATTPCPLMERISCHLSYSLQGNILSASSHDIHPPPSPLPPHVLRMSFVNGPLGFLVIHLSSNFGIYLVALHPDFLFMAT